MPSVQIAKFRKVSAGILASAALAAEDDRPAVSKREVSLTLKRVAPALGIQGTAYHVLDILLGLVQVDDFQPGRRPVVAISNQRLADYTSKTTRTVTRCLKKLVEVGILAYRDSPTGRRYVYRDRAGEAEQAYGLDFTPACHNLEVFRAQADAFQAHLKRQQDAKRTVGRCSRAIVDLVEAGGGDYQLFADRAEYLIQTHKGDVEECAAKISVLYEEALSAYQSENEPKMSCAGDIDVSPLSITNHPDSLESNKLRTCSNEQDTKFTSDNGIAVEMAFEKKHCGAGRGKQQASEPVERPEARNSSSSALDGVSIGLINSACSQIREETGLDLSSWPKLCDAAGQLRVFIGLSPSAYSDAVERQGRYLAAACLAVVAEKALRDPQQISSPGGYFRAMIDRAGDHKLHLHKSLHGLV